VWTAIEAGKDIAFANKEVLVAAGQAVMALVKEKNVAFLPVDSEHSAIFQCLEQDKSSVESLILTASGGPFVDFSQEQLAEVKAAAALCHPTWQMGSKVTIDSATMMNKGLEVMEAHWLFNIPYDKIQILVHQESIVHSLVQYGDGSLLAHLGPHDMRIPIQYALTYPRRRQNKLEKLDLAQVGSLHFRQPDFIKFPCLGLAYEAGIMGGTLPAVLNAANEELVGAFLKGEIGFLDIPRYIEKTLHRHELKPAKKLAAVLEADAWARAVVRKDYLRR
ncbi:MAG: 1-deoxy-D-xylulose-5-phosphate reductoisomerase, partial [Clostridiales bacterium]